MRVKICGVSTHNALDAAVHGGADAVGFVFSHSPRQVTVDQACELVRGLPPFVTTVAVFRRPPLDLVRDVVTRFRPHLVQTEPEPAVQAFLDDHCTLLPVFHDHPGLLEEAGAYHARYGGAALLEAPGQGGRGIVPDWSRAAQLARVVPVVLAGGLHKDNVVDAIYRVRPYGVDVSSGVESARGVKDPGKIRSFLATVRGPARLEYAP